MLLFVGSGPWSLGMRGTQGWSSPPSRFDIPDGAFPEDGTMGRTQSRRQWPTALLFVWRLRAMIENLKETLPSHRQDELKHQLMGYAAAETENSNDRRLEEDRSPQQT